MKNIIFNFNIVTKSKEKDIKHCKRCKRQKRVIKNIFYYNNFAEINIISSNYNVTTLVSIEDADFCKNLDLYYNKGYIYANGKGLHRVLVERRTIVPKTMVIDHINRNPLDNRIDNLRITNKGVNALNTNKIIKGYRYRKDMNKFEARIKVRGKQISLDCFDTIQEARKAYLRARRIYFPQI